MTTPRELSADEIAAIRERYEERQRAKQAWSNVDISDPAYGVALEHWRMMSMRVCMDIPALLAHVAAVDARCRAYEAALRPFAELLPRYAEYVAECHEEGIIASNFTGWVDWFGWSSDEMKAN